jgi:hypothetical protein
MTIISKMVINTEHYLTAKGLRYVIPYWYDFKTRPKRRWVGTKIIDMYLKEFPYYTREYLVVIDITV